MRVLTVWVGRGAVLAGIVWLGVWWHQQLAHGPTSDNEMNLVAGLTWMDSSKLLVLPLALVLAALTTLLQPQFAAGLIARIGAGVTIGGLILLIVMTAIEFWIFPWGSYAVRFEDANGLLGSNLAGALQAATSMVFTLGMVISTIQLVRVGRLRWWAAAVLVLGAFFTVYFSPVFLVPAAAWVMLGLLLRPRTV